MKKIIILILLIITIFTTGCSYKEINDLAIASAIGIDYENKEYTITLQIMDLSKTKNNEGKGIEESTLMYVGKGKSIASAIRNISLKYPNTVYLGHLELMIIGKGILEHGIENTFDYFMRSAEAKTETLILVTDKYKAEDIINPTTEQKEAFPTKDIVSTIENSNEMNGTIVKMNMQDFISLNLKPGIDPIAPSIKLAKDVNKQYKDTKLIGMNVFKNNKLIELVKDEAITAYKLIMNDYTNLIVDVMYKNDVASIVLNKPKNSFEVKVKDDKVEINININTQAYLTDANNNVKKTDDKTLKELEKILNRKLKEYITTLIDFSKETNTDVLGVKNQIYKHYNKEYDKYKNQNVYEDANIKINTKARLFRYGNSTTSIYGGNK